MACHTLRQCIRIIYDSRPMIEKGTAYVLLGFPTWHSMSDYVGGISMSAACPPRWPIGRRRLSWDSAASCAEIRRPARRSPTSMVREASLRGARFRSAPRGRRLGDGYGSRLGTRDYPVCGFRCQAHRDGRIVSADRSEMASLGLDRVVRWDTETSEAETYVYGAGGFSPRSTFSLRASGRSVG